MYEILNYWCTAIIIIIAIMVDNGARGSMGFTVR